MNADQARRTLVLMAGLPGTGKTTLAYALANELHWPVLDKDLLNGVLLDGGLAQPQAAPLAYDMLFVLGQDLLIQQQQSVILDSAGRLPFILERGSSIAQLAAARLKIVRCVAPQAIRAERLANRIAKPSQWVVDQATDEDQEQWYAHLPPETLVIATDRPMVAYIDEVMAYLV